MITYPMFPPGVVEACVDGVEYVRLDGPVIVAVRGDAQIVYCPAAAWAESPAALHVTRIARIAAIEAELSALKAQAAPPPLLAAPATAPRTERPWSSAPIPCPQCGRLCAGSRGIKMHVRLTHPPEPKPAVPPTAEPAPGGAAEVAPPPPAATIAVAVAAEPERITCRHCGRVCQNTRGLSSHERGCPERPGVLAHAAVAEMIGCPVCGHRCKDARGLAIHRARRHRDGGATAPVAPITAAPAPPAFLALLRREEDAFSCPQCRSSAFTEALSHPGLCVRCARAQAAEAA